MYRSYEVRLNQLLATIPSPRNVISFAFDNAEAPTSAELKISSKIGEGETVLPFNVVSKITGNRLVVTDSEIEDSPHARFLVKLANHLLKHPLDTPERSQSLREIEEMLARYQKPKADTPARNTY